MAFISPDIEKKLYAETDARFWAQTGYRPGQKLDPKSVLDRKMIPVWTDIYNKVKAQYNAGKIVWTYDHPQVVGLITEAAHEFAKAADAVTAAIATANPVEKNVHAAAAADAHQKANDATAKAATYQPPTASPVIAQHAANQVAQVIISAPPQVTSPMPSSPAAPPPTEANPTPTPRDSIDALQVAHAPIKAQATADQAPAIDAPVPEKKMSPGKTALVVGGCLVAISIGAALTGKTR